MIVKGKSLAVWQIQKGDKIIAVIWSFPYKTSTDRALKKWRKLSGSEDEEVIAIPMTCPVDNCWNFATDLLSGEGLSIMVSNEWWFVADVELNPGDKLLANSICPLCERHARRFRRSVRERLWRIEERLDVLERDVKSLG